MTNSSNNNIRFDLIEMVRIGLKWKKHIIGFAFLVAVATAIYMFTLKNIYSSYAVFYPAGALIGSRNNLFRTEHQDGVDMIGLDNEVDRLVAIGNSAPILSDLIKKYKMAEHYKIDIVHDAKGKQKVYKKFAKAFKVSKGANNNLELNMRDWDGDLAGNIANDALIAIQDNIRSYYTNSNNGIAIAMEKQMTMQDSAINTLTEKLVAVREKYGVYDIISPSRKIESTVQSRNARGIEEVQNLEELKDKYVMDRAKYESIRNEFLTGNSKSIPYIHVVQYPTAGGPKVGPYRTLNVLGAGAAAAFLALLFVVLLEYFASVKHLFKAHNG
jgi:hypothetical protein